MSLARRIHYARVLSVLIVLHSTDCTVSVRPKHTSNVHNKHTKKETLVAAWMTSRHSLKSIDYTKEFKQYFNTTLEMTETPQGQLTPHGKLYAEANGAYYWEQYGKSMGDRLNCKQLAQLIKITADTDQRDKDVRAFLR